MYPQPDQDTQPLPQPAMHQIVRVSAAPAPSWDTVKPKTTPERTAVFAEPVRLLYDVRAGGDSAYTASGYLQWQTEGPQYSARLDMSAFGFRLRTWTSKGRLGQDGLQPDVFGDKPRGAEQSTRFQRDRGIITFSENTLEVPLQTGAQDKLSALLQLGALVAGAPGHYPANTHVNFQAADAHRAERWTFKAAAMAPVELPGGMLSAIQFTKEPTPEFDQRIEVWLAPAMQYLPVRLRITEANGAFADLLWRKSQKPD